MNDVRPDDEFDRLVEPSAPPMIVVTTSDGDERAGCLVGFHAQCSIGPRQYAVWISKENHTFSVAARADHFAVHFLEPSDTDLAELFGGRTGDEIDKFEHCDWEPARGGVPVLTRCRHRFVGERVGVFDAGGDHIGIVLSPVDVETSGGGGGASTGSGERLRLPDVDGLDAGHPPRYK